MYAYVPALYRVRSCYGTSHHDTRRYISMTTLHCIAVHYNVIQYNTLRRKATHHSTMRYNATHCSTPHDATMRYVTFTMWYVMLGYMTSTCVWYYVHFMALRLYGVNQEHAQRHAEPDYCELYALSLYTSLWISPSRLLSLHFSPTNGKPELQTQALD